MPGNARLLIGHGRAKNDFFITRPAMPIIWAWLGIIKNWSLTTNDFTLQLLIGRCVEWYFFASLWLILRCVGLDTHWNSYALKNYQFKIKLLTINFIIPSYAIPKPSVNSPLLTSQRQRRNVSELFPEPFPAFWQIPFTHCSGLPFKTHILPSFAEPKKIHW